MKRVIFILVILVSLSCLRYSSASVVPTAEIVSVRSPAYVFIDGKRKKAVAGIKVYPGTRLETGSFGRLSVLLPDQTLLKISRNSHFVYEGEKGEKKTWFLEKGAIWLRRLLIRSRINVRTPHCGCGCKGDRMVY